jgi:endonuclease YncB( thermonuclease family)
MRARLLPLVVLPLFAGVRPPEGGYPPPPEHGVVASVYDGDTVTLASGDKIRLRWVNTPEMKPEEPWAREARALTEGFVLGKDVKLAVAPSGRDGYGRVVAGLETETGTLSLALLEAGLGHLFVIPPDDTDLSAMLAAQDRARTAGIGIWSTWKGDLHITSLHNNGAGDDNADPNVEYMRIANITSKPVDLGGYRLRNKAGEEKVFPHAILPAGHTVRVHSGRGGTITDPLVGVEIHLGHPQGFWDDEGEIALLLTPEGVEIDRKVAGHP